jgi:c-di-GMP-binding flagellar brake protein YcgR
VNRRRERRSPFKAPIEIRASSGVTYRGVARDLSPFGMGALISASLNIGEEIWIKYEHPASGSQIARAIVRRATVKERTGYRYGFEFQVSVDVEPSVH